MTADFGNIVDKTDEKRKTTDEMNPAYVSTTKILSKNFFNKCVTKGVKSSGKFIAHNYHFLNRVCTILIHIQSYS